MSGSARSSAVVTRLVTGFRASLREEAIMAICIYDDFMSLDVDGHEAATARWSQYAGGRWFGRVDRLVVHQPTVRSRPSDYGPDGRRTTGDRTRRRRPGDGRAALGAALVTDRLIRITAALAVIAVAGVAAILSY